MYPSLPEIKQALKHFDDFKMESLSIKIYLSKSDLINQYINKHPDESLTHLKQRLNEFNPDEPVIAITYQRKTQYFHLDEEKEAYDYVESLASN